MNMHRLQVYIEDNGHRKFLEFCQDIICELNKECRIHDQLKLEIENCDGKTNMVCNKLQSLILLSKRHLLVHDLNDYTIETHLIQHIVTEINKSKTFRDMEVWNFVQS